MRKLCYIHTQTELGVPTQRTAYATLINVCFCIRRTYNAGEYNKTSPLAMAIVCVTLCGINILHGQ